MLRRFPTRLVPRLATSLLALAVIAAYATAGQGRAVAAAGSWTWEAAADSPVLSPAERTSVRAGRPADGTAGVRAPFATLPAQPSAPPPASGGCFSAPPALADHPSVLLETCRSSRGPPALSFA
jgi:hypothetical protein